LIEGVGMKEQAADSNYATIEPLDRFYLKFILAKR